MHQCPKCELRFRSADELNDHLVRDHRVAPEDLPTRRRQRSPVRSDAPRR